MGDRLRRRWLSVVMALAVCASAAWPQTFVPGKITFSGSELSQAELLAYTGLHPGEAITRDQMQAASDKLTGTGLFTDVRFSFDGSELSFALNPSVAVVPVRYDNFPWWDDATLNSAVATKVPLFHGSLDPGGPMREQVIAVLTSLLAAKGVEGAAIGTSPIADANGDQVAIAYRIDAPAVVVEPVRIEGYSGVWTQPLQSVEKAIDGQPFDASMRDKVTAAVRAVYDGRGFLGMTMTDPAWGEPRLMGVRILVPLKVAITSEGGGQFRVSGLHLEGDLFMTDEQFAQRSKLHVGDVANPGFWKQTQEMIAAPYKTHGYIEAKIDAVPALDRTKHTVDYTIKVEPGAVYRIGKLTVANLSEAQKAEVLPYWKMREGDVFNASLIPQFMEDYHRLRAPELQSIRGWSFHAKWTADKSAHTVDVLLTFEPPAR
jgi:outer membrane protein insertion porin family